MEFNLVDDSSINAWAMPGGKVVVYKGILPVAENETGLAVVMGHEIAHVIANHGNERMSQALLTQMGGNALGAALAQVSVQVEGVEPVGVAPVGVELVWVEQGWVEPVGAAQGVEAPIPGYTFLGAQSLKAPVAEGTVEKVAEEATERAHRRQRQLMAPSSQIPTRSLNQ